jgi:hypothetical protein
MPTGLTNSPTLQTSIPQKSAAPISQAAVNITFTVVLRTTGIPQPCPPYWVPLQASVNVRGQNGKAAGNSAPVFVGVSPNDVSNGGGRMITPDTEIFYPVDSTSQIWVNGTAGDGIQVTITANPIG